MTGPRTAREGFDGGAGGSRLITPVLLCGGAGTRLWPLSRRSFPKQFVTLAGDRSLFRQAAGRLSGPGFGPPLVVTAGDFRFIITEQLRDEGIVPAGVLIEPEPRNTAPAILAAVLAALARDPEAMLLIAPSDHVIADPAAFRQAVALGLPAAEGGAIVTFGIRPDRAETGYGWLEPGGPSDPAAAGSGAVPLAGFVEKPDAARAAGLLASGRHLWNAGIFLGRADRLHAAFLAHAPGLVPGVAASLAGARPDLDFLRLDPAPWAGLPDISIDYAVMEQASGLMVVPYDGAWSDLGDWAAVRRESPIDAAGNSQSGPVLALDCENSLLRSESEGITLVGLGLKGVIAIATADAVLVADIDRAQEVKTVVATLRAQGVAQAESSLRDHRPWGWFETLALGERFQVKRIVVRPGGTLSLQSHHHRAEHWIVVQGTARVTVGDEVRLVSENQSVYVPLGAMHRMENPGKLPMVLIEVQTGAYLGEDDIVRHDDVYARGQGARG